MPTAGLRNVVTHLRTAASLKDALALPDGELLERYVAAGDGVAFEALVRRHGPMVLSVCRRLLANPCDAEDAFQATFLVLVRKAPSVVPREKVASWLYGVACHAAQKVRTATFRRRCHERQVRALPEPATVADELWHDLAPLLDQELSRLPEKYRLPLVLCDLEGRTRTEAARHLAWPEGTVAGRLARGRALLARRLARHGPPVSAGVLAALLAQNAASACVPVALVISTSKAAAAEAVPERVAVLISGVLRAMFLSKLKAGMTAVLLAVAVLGFAGLLAHRTWAERPAEPGEPPREQAKDDAKKPDRPEDAAAKELKSLQGDWNVVALAAAGQRATPDDVKGMSWTFKGARIAGINPGDKKATEFGEVKLDPTKTPKHFDLVPLEGEIKGKSQPGIYKLEDGLLTVCLRDEKALEKGRPKEFTADAGSDQGLIVLERPEQPGAPAKPEAGAQKGASDAMEGKRWVVKDKDTLELVGPAGTVGPPIKLPRYRLKVGQELVYKGDVSIGSGRSRFRQHNEWHVWAVGANKDGGWHLVVRHRHVIPEGVYGNPEQQRGARFTRCELFPDGRTAEAEAAGRPQLTHGPLPLLPASAAEAARGWTAKEEAVSATYRYRLLPPPGAGRCALEVTLEPGAGVVAEQGKGVLTFDTERGLPEKAQWQGKHERATLQLDEAKAHDEAWCREFAADAERCFAAEGAYYRVLARPGAAPAEVKAALEKAEADLKAARRGLTRPEFQEQADALLAEHGRQAKAAAEEAERRVAVIGQPAADWSTTDLDGKAHALKDYRGKVLILEFWYKDCFWCVRAMPQVKEVAAHFKERPVVVLGMNTNDKDEDARQVVQKVGLNYATLKAAGLAEKYRVQGFPTLVVIDQEGVVRDIHVGYSPDLREDVVKSVERLLKAKP
jgi:RNA polymerase sigma factor (sigma-70 family)